MTKPIFDCRSCPAYQQLVNDQPQMGGACHHEPPRPQLIGADKLGRPLTMSFYPQVGKGDWCMKHPMASAFQVVTLGRDAGALAKPFEVKRGNGESQPLPEAAPLSTFEHGGISNVSVERLAPASDGAFDVEATGADDGD